MDKQKLEKCRKWLNRIHITIADLSNAIAMWEKVVKIEEQSEHFKEYGKDFKRWQTDNFNFRLILQLSSLTELEINRYEDNRSFADLLNYIQEYDILKNLTSSQIQAYHKNRFEIFNGDETKFKNNILVKLNEDIEKIKDIDDKINKIRNKEFAHLTKEKNKHKQTLISNYSKIFSFVDDLHEMANRYSELLLGCSWDITILKKPDLSDLFSQKWL